MPNGVRGGVVLYPLIARLSRSLLLLVGATFAVYWIGNRATTVPMPSAVYAELSPAEPVETRMVRIREMVAAHIAGAGDEATLYRLGVTATLVHSADAQPPTGLARILRSMAVGVEDTPSARDLLANLESDATREDLDFYRGVASHLDGRPDEALDWFTKHIRGRPTSVTERLALANKASILVSQRSLRAKELRDIGPQLRAAVANTEHDITKGLLMLRLGQVYVARHQYARGADMARAAALRASAHHAIAHAATSQVKAIENRRLDVGYVQRMAQIARFDLGRGASGGRLSELIPVFLRNTLALAGLATVVALGIAAPLGVLVAARPEAWSVRTAQWAVYLVSGIPAWLLGLIALRVPARVWGVAKTIPEWDVLESPVQRLLVPHKGSGLYFALMALTLAFGNSLVSQLMQRVARAASLVLSADYILAVRSRQASVFHHLARNLRSPVLIAYASYFPALLSGAIVVEAVFNYDGVGLALWEAAAANDTDFATMVPICILLVGLVFIANVLRDILLVIVDPRLRT